MSYTFRTYGTGALLKPTFYLHSAPKGAWINSGKLEVLRTYGVITFLTNGQVIYSTPDKPIPRS